MLNRLVKIIYPPNDKNKSDINKFVDILTIPNIVLLGEPGAGKSYLFEKGSEYENGVYISARNFPLYANDTYTDKPVYIDALDEKRSRAEQSPNSIDNIIEHLLQIHPSKLRLSCRAADWLGETDLEIFKPYFEANGGYCVVVLEQLTVEEIDQILASRGVNNPSDFQDKASEKGLSSMLTNPQTLIMLADSTKNGQFPSSKKELYENAIDLLLTEHNKNHQHKVLTGYSLHELKDAAGLACAILLIADVEGISLIKSANNSYASLPYSNTEIILAALTKRVFVMENQRQELITSSHRTIAEYLAASYLVKLIRKGLPIGRVRSWLGVEGYPSSELRGLYAWLTQLLPEYADVLLTTDPYGVLVYGDASCLSLSSKKTLLQSLIKLAEKDPWFRGQDWTSEPLGALSIPEMTNDFKELLLTKPRQFHLLSIVLDAIKHGEQQPELENILLDIFCDEKAYYAVRHDAFECLLNAIPNGEALVVKATKDRLQKCSDGLRLKAAVLAEVYEGNFICEDVIQLIKDYMNIDHTRLVGDLWSLRYSLPLKELPNILDGLAKIQQDKDVEANHEVSGLIYEILKRILNDTSTIEPTRLWKWLSGLQKFKPYQYSLRNEDEIKNWLIQNEHYVLKMFVIALNENEFDEPRAIWVFWHSFQNTVRFSCNTTSIINTALSFIKEKDKCTEKEQSVFQFVLSLTFNLNPPDLKLFNRLITYGDSHSELSQILQDYCFCPISDWRQEDIVEKAKRKNDKQAAQQKNRCDFEHNLELILTGQHIGWLEWLAKVYFARFVDSDRSLTPRERFTKELGKDNVESTLEGIRAIIHKTDLPASREVANRYIQDNSIPYWWLAILSGITEHYKMHGDLDLYSERLLKASLAINLICPSFYTQEKNVTSEIKPTWQQDLFQDKPELVQTVYLEIIEIFIQTKRGFIPGIREICENPLLEKNRAEMVLKLLKSHPNTPTEELRTLLLTVITFPEKTTELIVLVQSNLKPQTRVRRDRRELWLSIGFLIAFEQFKDLINQCAEKHESVIWVLIDIVGRAYLDNDKERPFNFSTAQIEFLIYFIGKRFSDEGHPTEPYGGRKNAWDAADFVKTQITKLSTRTTPEAGKSLEKLVYEPKLESYLHFLKHASENRAALHRKELFNQPNWAQTVEVLSNGKPAHVADLHALLINHLKDISKQIRDGNTDIYKSFWNEDSYGRITNPKNEESCRDRLIDLLKPRLSSLEISVEPEGHMATDKRADILLSVLATLKLPIEIKRNYHKDLWTACTNQLDRLYTRDPQACGYGIYLVFWFGDKRTKKRVNPPPESIKKPNTARELEDALQSLIKPKDSYRLISVVIDVTCPEK